MTHQRSLFDIQKAAIESGQRGMDSAAAKLDRRDCELVTDAIVRMAKSGEAFTSEDVFFSLPLSVQDRIDNFPQAMGSFFRSLARRGRIAKTGRSTRATRTDAKGRDIALWRRGDVA